jgi:hypothetical protein
MPIAPVDAQTVGADQLDRHRSDVERHPGGIEQWSPAHLFDAAGAGARQAKGTSRKESQVTALVPLDEEAVVAPVDGVGDGVHGGYGLWAMGYGKIETPRILGGFLDIGAAIPHSQ